MGMRAGDEDRVGSEVGGGGDLFADRAGEVAADDHHVERDDGEGMVAVVENEGGGVDVVEDVLPAAGEVIAPAGQFDAGGGLMVTRVAAAVNAMRSSFRQWPRRRALSRGALVRPGIRMVNRIAT